MIGDNMKIRLGYVALPLTINITSSSTVTVTNYNKLGVRALKKIDETIDKNLDNLLEILKYNQKNNIHFYRLTSKLIPLATFINFDYLKKFKKKYRRISKFIKQNNMRVDLHPDQFIVLNSDRESVVNASIQSLKYHANILKILDVENPIIILHLGSSVGGKKKSIERFKNNFYKLDKSIQQMISLENDDKVYNIRNVLKVCKELDIPFTFDYHHYKCNNNGEKIEDYIEDIFYTWIKKGMKPKMHFSSPKSKQKKDFRSHHDYIDSNEFINFLERIKHTNCDFDIMIEAKKKDEAVSKLIRELKYYTEYTFLDETTFKIK